MIYVNKEGHRVANEKLAYNEMAQVFFEWDGARAEYPNLLLIAIGTSVAKITVPATNMGASLCHPDETMRMS